AKALVKYAIRNITSFSSFPLKLITYLGVLVLFVSVVLGGITLYQKAIGTSLDGFTTVIVAILFIGSMIMISLGIIGYYISQIYNEIKQRPRYVISEKCGK
ncbi:MAG: glycosyltransferase, partial [Clostridia bacterium]|nr:glycosyltransferase [Clostridia bacterium]